MPLVELSAQQPAESGSTTVEAGVQTPAESQPVDENPEDPQKKDERPRELGVLILIVWILAGSGIGILIFTSLFGHSVRSMIRRPYPPQAHPDHQKPAENASESNGETQQAEPKSPHE